MDKFKLKRLLEFVEPYYSVRDPMRDLSHFKRVIKEAFNLAELHDIKFDEGVLTCGACFHGLVERYEDNVRCFLRNQGLRGRRLKRSS